MGLTTEQREGARRAARLLERVVTAFHKADYEIKTAQSEHRLATKSETIAWLYEWRDEWRDAPGGIDLAEELSHVANGERVEFGHDGLAHELDAMPLYKALAKFCDTPSARAMEKGVHFATADIFGLRDMLKHVFTAGPVPMSATALDANQGAAGAFRICMRDLGLSRDDLNNLLEKCSLVRKTKGPHKATVAALALHFGVGDSWIERWIERERKDLDAVDGPLDEHE